MVYTRDGSPPVPPDEDERWPRVVRHYYWESPADSKNTIREIGLLLPDGTRQAIPGMEATLPFARQDAILLSEIASWRKRGVRLDVPLSNDSLDSYIDPDTVNGQVDLVIAALEKNAITICEFRARKLVGMAHEIIHHIHRNPHVGVQIRKGSKARPILSWPKPVPDASGDDRIIEVHHILPGPVPVRINDVLWQNLLPIVVGWLRR